MGIEELILTTERKRAERRGEKLGEKRGIERKEKEIILHMIRKNLSDESIVDFTGISLNQIREIRASL